MLRAYETWTPRGRALDTIEKANEIIRDYRRQGFDLTLRQLYYQFVSKAWLANTEQNYKALGETINRARMAGLMDWNAIVDRTRHASTPYFDESPEEVLRRLSFFVDRWEGQATRVEVWVEKEALAGIVGQVAHELGIGYFACRGYVSASAMWAAAQRIGRYMEDGQNVLVLHLGDHDPSGIDMTRDNRDRLDAMLDTDWAHTGRGYHARPDFEIRRVALNMDQVRQYEPPPNPAKLTDSRAGGYVGRFGYSSWELDALDPTTLAAIIRSHVLEVRDEGRYLTMIEKEEAVQAEFEELGSVGWVDIREWLESRR